MKLLLDSHTLLWAISAPDELSDAARAVLKDVGNELFVSAASLWEIELKVQSGKLKLPSRADFLEVQLRSLGVEHFLSIDRFHIRQTRKLPPVHKDPFDRLLVAQAIAERMVLVSKDRVLREYPVGVIW